MSELGSDPESESISELVPASEKDFTTGLDIVLMLRAGDVETVTTAERPSIAGKGGFRCVPALCICLVDRVTD